MKLICYGGTLRTEKEYKTFEAICGHGCHEVALNEADVAALCKAEPHHVKEWLLDIYSRFLPNCWQG